MCAHFHVNQSQSKADSFFLLWEKCVSNVGAEALGPYWGEGKWKACGACGLLNEGWEHVAVLSLVMYLMD